MVGEDPRVLAHCRDGSSRGRTSADPPHPRMSLPSPTPPPFRPPSPTPDRGRRRVRPTGRPGPARRGAPGACSCSCFLRCRSRLVCCPKHRLHRWHLKGFSLLWMLRTCRWRLEEMLKERSQYLHLEGTRLRGAPSPAPGAPPPEAARPPHLEGGHGEAVLEAARLRGAGALPSNPREEGRVGMCPEVVEGTGDGGSHAPGVQRRSSPPAGRPRPAGPRGERCAPSSHKGAASHRGRSRPRLSRREQAALTDRGEPGLSGSFPGPVSVRHSITWGLGPPKRHLSVFSTPEGGGIPSPALSTGTAGDHTVPCAPLWSVLPARLS